MLAICESAIQENGMSFNNYDKNHKASLFGEFSSSPREFIFLPDEKETFRRMIEYTKAVVDTPEENAGLRHFTHANKTCKLACQSDLIYTVFGLVFSKNQEPKKIEHSKEAIQSQATIKDNLWKSLSHTHQMLSTLKELADRNVSRPKQGRRFTNDIKQFSTAIRILAGPFLYEILQKNLELALPSIDTTNRIMRNMKSAMVDGRLQTNELLQYLTERNLPLVVALSEDATCIEGKIQYNAKTNQVSGFVLPLNKNNGMPVPLSFPAQNVAEIVEHFSRKNEVAKFVNVVMAQPVSVDCPAFPLLLFASDGKYTAEDVTRRWAHITNELSKVNIKTLTIASDSEPKFNSAMRKLSLLGMKSNTFDNVEWFCSGLDEVSVGPFFLQDINHILTKLRNFLLKTRQFTSKLQFGSYLYIKLDHLLFLLKHLDKDEHPLTASILDPTDRQNVSSAKKICDDQVIWLLKQHLKRTGGGTATFLQIMRDVTDAFSDRKLSPLKRVEKIWYSLFVIRIWRSFVTSKSNLTLKNNFLSHYTYSCIELNAHSLIHLMMYLKNNDLGEWFLPFLFDSQACESFFRKVRSLTSVYHRVANCSVKEIIGRLNRIQMLEDIANKTSFFFPRMQNKKYFKTFELPTKEQIFETISSCGTDAINYALEIGLLDDETVDADLSCHLPVLELNPNKFNARKSIVTNKESFERIMNQLKRVKLKNFANKFTKSDIAETSPFVEVHNNGTKRIVVKKSSLCWLLRDEPGKLSSDRVIRVRGPSNKTKKTQTVNKNRSQTPKLQSKLKKKKNHMIYNSFI